MMRFACLVAALTATALWCNDADAHFRRARGGCCSSAGTRMCACAGPATIVLEVRADAKVYFNGEPTSQTGTTRVYETPPLPVGCDFTYDVKVGSETRTVMVRAFCTTTVDFTKPLDSGELPDPSPVPDLPESFFPKVQP